MKKRVLVTGATGFVGGVLCEKLAESGYIVRAAMRSARQMPASVAEMALVGEIGDATNWKDALRNVDAVVHLAARAHILGDQARNDDLYMEVNALGTRRLAQSAAKAGIRRLVFMSSVKVNGEDSGHSKYSAEDSPRPSGPYARSKAMAEQILHSFSGQAGFDAICVRSPLVYGPGVRANFLRLMRWVDHGWPIPFGAVNNRRSLVSVWNLCDLLVRAVESPAAVGRTFMVSDGEDLSTPDLMRRIGGAMNKRVRLLPVPVAMLAALGGLAGRRAEIARLCGSLAVDVTQTRKELGWHPLLTVDEGLARTISWYLSEGRFSAT